jgi:thiol-disulfide isomerase/thioredoxin
MPTIRSIAAVALVAFATSPLCAQVLVPATPTVPGGQPAKPAVKAAAKDGAKDGAKQDVKRTIDPKAKALYDKALAAVKAAKSVQFTGQMTLGGDDPAMKAMMPPEMMGKSRFTVRYAEAAKDAKAPEPGMGLPPIPPDSIRAERVDGPKQGTVLVIHDGKVLEVDPAKKTYTDGGAQAAFVALMGIQSFPEFLRRGGLELNESDLISIELAGTTTVDELECDVVKLVHRMEAPMGAVPNEELDGEDGEEGEDGEDGDDGMKPAMVIGGMTVTLHQTLAIARIDGLPRRQTTKPEFGDMPQGLDMEDGMEDGGMAMPAPEMIFTVFGLKLDPKIDDAAFSLSAPEGFTKTEPEMPGFMAGAEGEEPGMPELTVKVGDAAPDFTLTDLGGKEVTLASLKGKVVLLDFWATWCGPCKAAMPTMQKLHDDYKDKGVVILGVNTWEQEADAAKAYMTKKKFTYGCLLKGDELAAAYGVRGIPTLVVIGKDGKVAEVEVGLADPSGAGLRKVLDAALAR